MASQRQAARRRALVARYSMEVGEQARVREARELLGSVRASLDPAYVGPALAGLFMDAVASRNVGLLRVMMPYVLGRPEETQQQVEGGVKALLEIMALSDDEPPALAQKDKPQGEPGEDGVEWQE